MNLSEYTLVARRIFVKVCILNFRYLITIDDLAPLKSQANFYQHRTEMECQQFIVVFHSKHIHNLRIVSKCVSGL